MASPDTTSSQAPSSPRESPEPVRGDPSDASLIFRVRHVLLVVRERWIGGLAIALVVCSLVAFTMLRRPPVYSATAALMVDRPERVVEIKSVVETEDPNFSDTALPTHMEQMRGHTFLARVVASLNADERRLLLGPAPVPAPGDAPAAPVPAAVADSQLEGLIKGSTTITNPRRSTLISVTVAHGDPRAAQLIANRVCDQYVLHLIDRSGMSNSAALTFLRERSEELRKKVESSELALQHYREKHNLVVVEENQKIVVDRISALSTSATGARVTRLALEAQLTQMETLVKAGPDGFLRSSPTESASVAAVQKDIDQLVAQRAVLAERYGKRHPVMLDNERSREALEKIRRQNLETHMQSALADLRNQVNRARANEQQLAKEVSAAEKEALRLDELAVAYNVLRREVETSRQMYTQIFLRQGETAVSSQLRNTNVRIADRADLPKQPSSLDKSRLALILGFLALGCLVGYAVLADMADPRIKSWLHVESYLDALLLAEIGVVKAVKESDRTQVVSTDGDSATAELFRALHSQISLTSQRPAPKTLLVTSTVPSEGKSFVAANLAAVFATHGKRTLLIDCDFRRPSLHRAFSLDNKHGFLRWLGEPAMSADVLADPGLGITEVSKNLSLLRSGGVSRRATELIENPRVVALLETLQNRFDILVLDTPPAGVFADAECFARLSDEIVYVCRFGSANRPHARQVLERLDKTDATVLGVVLNAMPARRQAEAYYYKYGYSGAKYQKEYAKAE